VNSTIACAKPGCVANTMLQAFDPNTEIARACRMSVWVHPTDFDNSWGYERIIEWMVNGRLARSTCNPGMRMCNSTSRPLFTCMHSVPVDHVLDRDGRLLITGKLGSMVDECPYNGNLLSAVASITCLVRSASAFPGGPGLGPESGDKGPSGSPAAPKIPVVVPEGPEGIVNKGDNQRPTQPPYEKPGTYPGGPEGPNIPGRPDLPWDEGTKGKFLWNGGFMFVVPLRCSTPDVRPKALFVLMAPSPARVDLRHESFHCADRFRQWD